MSELVCDEVIDEPSGRNRYVELADECLIRRARCGDHEAFGALWERYASGVRGVLSRFTEQPADLEDLAQDVFLKAFLALPKFRGDSQLFSWLYRIAFNTGVNFRSAKGRREYTNADHADIEAHVDPQQICIGKEQQNAAQSAIGDLSAPLQQALLLNTVRGFDYDSVGTLVGCPIGTVRSRISRARSTLMAAISE